MILRSLIPSCPPFDYAQDRLRRASRDFKHGLKVILPGFPLSRE
jgi:hypothetical protein